MNSKELTFINDRLTEIETQIGKMRITRNLAAIATGTCVLVGASPHQTEEEMICSFICTVGLACATFIGNATVKVLKEEKKEWQIEKEKQLKIQR